MARDSLDIQRSSVPLLERTESQRRLLCTPSPSHTKYLAVRTSGSVVPLPDRNAHGNRESTRVNIGLTFTGGPDHPDFPTIPHHALAKLTLPETTPAEAPTIEELIPRLIHPPPHAYLYNILSLAWVRSVLGEHLVFRPSDERYVLARDSELRTHGRSLGVPTLLLDWLCGDDEAIGSSEQNIMLTPDVFGG